MRKITFPLTIAAAAVVVGAVLSPLVSANTTTTATWTGAAGDNRFSTAGNWKEGRAPVDGVKLVFPCVQRTDSDYSIKITNDTNAKISAIDTPETRGVSSCKSYFIEGDTAFQDNVTLSGDANDEWLSNVAYVSLKSANNIRHLIVENSYVNFKHPEPSVETYTATGWQMYEPGMKVKNAIINSTDKGTINVGQVSESITLQSGAALNIGTWEDREVSTNITFQGDGSVGDGYYKTQKGGVGGSPQNVTTTLSGNIVVNGTVRVRLRAHETLKITGNLSGSGKIVVADDNEGVFINEAKSNETATESGVVDTAKEEVVSVDGDKKDEYLEVKRKQTAILKGTRGDVSVAQGGTLRGEGTVSFLSVSGVVAPGDTIGKITVLDHFSVSNTGVYQVDILNKDTYDKIAAGSVRLDEKSTLELNYLLDGKLSKGDTLTIIENTGNQPVWGNFKDMPEGAEVVVGNATFKISYKGGDGNDVTLEALNDSEAPKAPNTGMASLVANPVAAVVATVMSVAALAIATKRKATGRR